MRAKLLSDTLRTQNGKAPARRQPAPRYQQEFTAEMPFLDGTARPRSVRFYAPIFSGDDFRND
jgi:hypothetical protein